MDPWIQSKLDKLITHQFPMYRADEAFKMLINRKEDDEFVGKVHLIRVNKKRRKPSCKGHQQFRMPCVKRQPVRSNWLGCLCRHCYDVEHGQAWSITPKISPWLTSCRPD